MSRNVVGIVVSLVVIILIGVAPVVAQQRKPNKQKTPVAKPSPPVTPAVAAPTPVVKASPAESAGEEEIVEEEVLRVETELVSVPTIVLDRAGKPITKLRRDNFTVYENDVRQRIENFVTTEVPFEIALLLDTSGSTRGDLRLIQRAAESFIAALRPGDRVAIIAFQNETFDREQEAVVKVINGLTDDRAALTAALKEVQTSGGTPFYDALEEIAEKVFDARPPAELRGRRAIVALTDGVDSSSALEFADAREAVTRADLAVYFVQINTEDFVENRVLGSCEDEAALRFSRTQLRRYRKLLRPSKRSKEVPELDDFCRLGQFERLAISRKLYNLARDEMEGLAKNSGGKTFPAADLRDARMAFAQVAQEIGTQYNLGYYSSNSRRDGTFRRIRVELKSVPNAEVKAREGYTATKD